MVCSGRTVKLTSIPVLSASPLSAFVLALGGLEVGDTSVATDIIAVSPSILCGPAVGDVVEGAP
jgi:hypothetical protein